MKKNVFLLFIFSLSVFSESKKNKIYFQSIQSQNQVSKALVDKLNSNVLLNLIRFSKDKLNIISDDSLNSILKHQSSIQKIGLNETGQIELIGAALNFQELVTGKIREENEKLFLDLRIIKKSEDSNSYFLKNSFQIDFYKFQIEYYSEEIAKSILNQNYVVNKKSAPEFSENKLELTSIEFNQADSSNLNQLNFKLNDDRLEILLDELKNTTSEGDSFFNKNKFSEALKIYSSVNFAINGLSEESKNKIKVFQNEIQIRIQNSNTLVYKNKIDLEDFELKNNQLQNEKNLLSKINSYIKIRDDYLSLDSFAINSHLILVLNERIEKLEINYMSFKESKADEFYIQYKFSNSLKIYSVIIDFLKSKPNGFYYNRYWNKILKKISTTKESGTSYVEHKVDEFCDLAETENSRSILFGNLGKKFERKNSKRISIEYLKLGKSIILENPNFVNEKTETYFNQIAKKINGDSKTVNDTSISNLALIPIKYITNVGKGITDIFVFKFGYGLGFGAQGFILGTDFGVGIYPYEISTAYSKKESEISGNYFGEKKLRVIDDKKKDDSFQTAGLGIIGESNCISGYYLRLCEGEKDSLGLKKYSTINSWVGLGPSIFISLELHRIPELSGILIGQNWDLFNTGIKRYKYLSFEEVELISPNKKNKWSNNLGKFNWETAKEECENLGMKLPEKKDFFEAYDTGITKTWASDKIYFWTDEENSSKLVNIYFLNKELNYHSQNYVGSKDDFYDTRCIKNEE